MSAAFGPGDRLRCIADSDHGDAKITAGEVYTVHSVTDHPVPLRTAVWQCMHCDIVNGPGVVLMERHSVFGWCPCLFRPTWDDDETDAMIVKVIDTVQTARPKEPA